MVSQGLEKLRVWKDSRELAKVVYRDVLPGLPRAEQWGLSDQLRRASISVAANIAEGYGRHYFQERIRFCYIARGSLEELATLLGLAQELGLLDSAKLDVPLRMVEELRGELNGYIHYLKRRSGASAGSRTSPR